jgi:hypothetical protein
MIFKKAIIASALLTLTCIAANAEKNTIVVNLASGDNTQIYLDDDIVAKFTTDDMVFQSSRTNVSISRDEIKSFDFIETSGVTELETSDLKMEITASGINFYNLPENSTVQVYTTAGVQVFSATGNGELSVPGEKLTGGINLVRVNGTTYKVSFK